MIRSLLFFFLLFSYGVGAQELHVDSTRFITGNRCCTGINYAIPTADKGALFVGYDYGNPGGIIPYFSLDTSIYGNALIGKIDSNHQISWIKIYGGSAGDAATSAMQTPDGGYAVLCGTESDNGDITGFKGGVTDIWLLRLDGSGNLLWQKCYGSSKQDAPISLANTPDHGFVIAGTTYGSDGDVPFHYGDMWNADWLVIKTDSAGNVQWSKDLGGTGDEQNMGSILAIDSSYYLVSCTNSTDHDCSDTAWHIGVNTTGDYHVLKLDRSGNVLWDSSYGGIESDQVARAIFDSRDSTIVVIGSTNSNDYMVTGLHECSDAHDMWVTKMNKNGTLLWEKALGTTQDEIGTGICMSQGGGYIAYGRTAPYLCPDATIGDIGEYDCFMLSLDTIGSVLNSKVFGGVNIERPYSIVPYQKGYIATGVSQSSSFTEGSTNCTYVNGGAFISYIDYWPVGMQNVNSPTKELIVHPNPSTIEISIATLRIGSVTITNLYGQVVFSKQEYIPGTEVHVDGWDAGMYIVRWVRENGEVLTTRFVKE